ncbi:MAG: PH domain-containing protein [Planctomycetota bacterium]
MQKEQTLRVATFSPKVQAYWMLSGTIVCAFMCLGLIGFVALPLWLVFGSIFTTKYRNSLSCELTDRSLKFGKGIWTRVEKTVPLEKITDLGMVQGPIMRKFCLHTLSVETAGQSSPNGGSLLRLTGIEDTIDFREAVLEQRDRLALEGLGSDTKRASVNRNEDVSSSLNDGKSETLDEIRDTLRRIETLLEQRQA